MSAWAMVARSMRGPFDPIRIFMSALARGISSISLTVWCSPTKSIEPSRTRVRMMVNASSNLATLLS